MFKSRKLNPRKCLGKMYVSTSFKNHFGLWSINYGLRRMINSPENNSSFSSSGRERGGSSLYSDAIRLSIYLYCRILSFFFQYPVVNIQLSICLIEKCMCHNSDSFLHPYHFMKKEIKRQ